MISVQNLKVEAKVSPIRRNSQWGLPRPSIPRVSGDEDKLTFRVFCPLEPCGTSVKWDRVEITGRLARPHEPTEGCLFPLPPAGQSTLSKRECESGTK